MADCKKQEQPAASGIQREGNACVLTTLSVRPVQIESSLPRSPTAGLSIIGSFCSAGRGQSHEKNGCHAAPHDYGLCRGEGRDSIIRNQGTSAPLEGILPEASTGDLGTRNHARIDARSPSSVKEASLLAKNRCQAVEEFVRPSPDSIFKAGGQPDDPPP